MTCWSQPGVWLRSNLFLPSSVRVHPSDKFLRSEEVMHSNARPSRANAMHVDTDVDPTSADYVRTRMLSIRKRAHGFLATQCIFACSDNRTQDGKETFICFVANNVLALDGAFLTRCSYSCAESRIPFAWIGINTKKGGHQRILLHFNIWAIAHCHRLVSSDWLMGFLFTLL